MKHFPFVFARFWAKRLSICAQLSAALQLTLQQLLHLVTQLRGTCSCVANPLLPLLPLLQNSLCLSLQLLQLLLHAAQHPSSSSTRQS